MNVAGCLQMLVTVQVLREPVYMEDHVGVLEEEVSAGLVPLPVLPKYKQVRGTGSYAPRTPLLLLTC